MKEVQRYGDKAAAVGLEVAGARQNQEGLNAMWFPIFVQVNLLLRLLNETLNISDLILKRDVLNGSLDSESSFKWPRWWIWNDSQNMT